MGRLGFFYRVSRIGVVAALAMCALSTSGCLADAAGLGNDDGDGSEARLSDYGYGEGAGGVGTGEQPLVVRRGGVPSTANGPQPDPWKSAGPQPDPWTPVAPLPSTPPKPGGKD